MAHGPAFDVALSSVSVRDFDPVVTLDVRGSVEGDDYIDVSPRSQERIDREVVSHARVHQLKVSGMVYAFRTGCGKLIAQAQSEVGNDGRVHRMYFDKLLVLAS